MFKIEDRPLVIAPRFVPLFDAIFYRNHDRVNVIAPTQDGKSTTIAAATVLVAASEGERFTIIAPSQKKADIIMSQAIEFAVSNKVFASQLQLKKGDNLDRLKQERSKKNITFQGGGGIMTITLDAKNSKSSIQAAMGFGSKNIIADEAGLVDNVLWATVVRMLGGDFKDAGKKRRKILIKIGNPFYRNHFLKSSQSSRYHQVFHNWEDSVRDYENGYYGYSPEYIEEMREQALFDLFYECKFPDENEIDPRGYRQLVTSSDLRLRAEDQKIEPEGTPILGCDIGGGGDWNVYVMRWMNYAKVVGCNKSDDTMTNVVEIQRIMGEYKDLKAENIHIDDVGIGRGVRDRCREKGMAVQGVSSGSRAIEKDKYINSNMEMAWDMRKWLKRGDTILEPYEIKYESVWNQCTWYKYKTNSDKQMKLESKEDMKKERGSSPDFGDAFKLTFYQPPIIGVMSL